MAEASRRRARAFAPGHVTGFFAPRLAARDPRGRGSVGGGLVLNLGVTAEAEWRPGPTAAPTVVGHRGRPFTISRDVAVRLLARRPGRLTVRIAQELPTGQGFGTSSAGALATALAVAKLFGISRATAVETAHLADLFGRGGLGGVAAILGGGMELRLRPGIPPRGRIVRRPWDRPILVGSVGPPMPSPTVLGRHDAEAWFSGGSELVDEVARSSDPESFWRASELFTARARLAAPELQRTLRGLERRGARAAQAMFGNSFFAFPGPRTQRRELYSWLRSRTRFLADVTIPSHGARVLRDPAPPPKVPS